MEKKEYIHPHIKVKVFLDEELLAGESMYIKIDYSDEEDYEYEEEDEFKDLKIHNPWDVY